MVAEQEPKKSKYFPTKGSDWFALKKIVFENPEAPWEDIWSESDDIKLLRQLGGVFVNDAFMELWDKTSGLLFMDGGYGSSKTTYAITRLLIKCLENYEEDEKGNKKGFFRCYFGRQTKVDARKLHSNIISEIKRNNWEDKFKYTETATGNLEILCIENGNKFKSFGCDDPDFLKGIDSETTDILVDEINQISWEAFGMLFTRLRGNTGADLQMIGCFNNCDVYLDHWLRKFIYIGAGEEVKVESEEDKIVLDALSKINTIKHHSVYTDNWFQNNAKYYNSLVLKAGGNKEKIAAYCNGDWGVELSSQPYYKMFSRDKHVAWVEYDKDLDLWISFDENRNPYFPVGFFQKSGNELRMIGEIAAKNPYNSLEWVCDEIIRRYWIEDKEKGTVKHTGLVYICGDATSKKEDVKLEQGANFYTLVAKYLKCFNLHFRNRDSNPNNKMRQAFVNAALGLGLVVIKIHPKCTHMIEDFQQVKENPNKKVGGKDKRTETVNGVKGVQRHGHFGDLFDYCICEARSDAYLLYQNGESSYDVTGGGRDVRNGYEEIFKKKVVVDYEDKKDDEEDDDEVYIHKSKNCW